MTDAKKTIQPGHTPVQPGEVMIHVDDLRKSFGDNNVLNGITQDIKKGEKVVIIGPSGSGKSTFLRCLNLLEVPTSGKIIFEGIDLTVSVFWTRRTPIPRACPADRSRGSRSCARWP